jgi:hypothetical protein
LVVTIRLGPCQKIADVEHFTFLLCFLISARMRRQADTATPLIEGGGYMADRSATQTTASNQPGPPTIRPTSFTPLITIISSLIVGFVGLGMLLLGIGGNVPTTITIPQPNINIETADVALIVFVTGFAVAAAVVGLSLHHNRVSMRDYYETIKEIARIRAEYSGVPVPPVAAGGNSIPDGPRSTDDGGNSTGNRTPEEHDDTTAEWAQIPHPPIAANRDDREW